jgi:hypothetical protein
MNSKHDDEQVYIDEHGRRRRGEGYCTDKNGRRSSAWFHDPIMEGNHVRATRVGRAVAKDTGFTEQELDEMYGPETSDRSIRRARATARQLHGLTEKELDEIYGPEPE